MSYLISYFTNMAISFQNIMMQNGMKQATVFMLIMVMALCQLLIFLKILIFQPLLMINATMGHDNWFDCQNWIDNVMLVVSYIQVSTPFICAVFLINFVNYLVEQQLKSDDQTVKSTYFDDFSQPQGSIATMSQYGVSIQDVEEEKDLTEELMK